MANVNWEDWLRIPEALEYLHGEVGEKALRRWVALRQVESMRVGGQVFVSIESLDQKIKITPAVEQPVVANG
jgi:hypothetical protein